MPGTNSQETAGEAGGLERFRSVQRLRNHWSRPVGPRAYYWYLTFEQSLQLHSLAAECQEVIAFPYYDLIPAHGLHLTLDRISFEDDITADQLNDIEANAREACRRILSFDVTIGRLSGTRGAVGFTAFPVEPISELRTALRRATLSICPDAPVRHSEFHPHLTIAYANSDDVPAAQVIAAVERLNAVARVDVTIRQAALVLLERDQHSYTWDVVSQVPLRSDDENLAAVSHAAHWERQGPPGAAQALRRAESVRERRGASRGFRVWPAYPRA